MVRIIAFIAIGVALVAAAAAGYYYTTIHVVECDPQERTVLQSEHVGESLAYIVPMIAFSYSEDPNTLHISDMSVTRPGHYVQFKVLPPPTNFTVEGAVLAQSSQCEAYELLALRSNKGELYHMYLVDFLAYKDGKRPDLSQHFRRNIEPFFEESWNKTHSYSVKFLLPESLKGAKPPYPDHVLNDALANIRLNFQELGYTFDVASARHVHASAILRLDIHSATYLSENKANFNISRLSPMAN